MPLDKNMLFDFLEILDDELRKKITLIAAGGTAMTLLDLKASTIDIDFTISSNDRQEYDRVINMLQSGFKIDIWNDGWIFCTALPDDYLDISKDIKQFNNLSLKALNPIDIIVTKIARLNDRNIEDIASCINTENISGLRIINRAKNITYVGKDEYYKYNLQWVIAKFFS